MSGASPTVIVSYSVQTFCTYNQNSLYRDKNEKRHTGENLLVHFLKPLVNMGTIDVELITWLEVLGFVDNRGVRKSIDFGYVVDHIHLQKT